MGTSIRKVADFVRPPEDESSDSERSPRLGDRLHGTLEDVSVDSVEAVRDVRERE